jgi:hypothetical protein
LIDDLRQGIFMLILDRRSAAGTLTIEYLCEDTLAQIVDQASASRSLAQIVDRASASRSKIHPGLVCAYLNELYPFPFDSGVLDTPEVVLSALMQMRDRASAYNAGIL